MTACLSSTNFDANELKSKVPKGGYNLPPKGVDVVERVSIINKKSHRKKQAHFFFDSIWEQGLMGRTEAYVWLSNKLQIPFQDCHFKVMKRESVIKSMHFCVAYLNENYNKHSLPLYEII